MLRYIYILVCCLFIGPTAVGQAFCPKIPPKKFIFRDSAEVAQRWQAYRTTSTYPLIIRLYVIVVSDDDGSNLAASDDTVKLRIANMRDYYAPHSICFILSGIEHVRSTDLNHQNLSTEEGELGPYLRDGYITVFVHTELFDADGKHWGGWAYGIPNTYLSTSGSNMEDVQDILAHEMGHCFGLYHTFETAHGVENVNRNGGCRDCDTDGDLICDTPADKDTDPDFIAPATCEYTGLARDECGVPYQMAPTNIMTYGRRSCRDHFTTAQGGRARDFIIDQLGDLVNCIAPDIYNVTTVGTYTNGFVSALARVIVTYQSPAFTVSNSARLYSSAIEIVVKPGSYFNPGSGGVVELRPNTYCQ
jgi:Metallo-peptidase family M12B Reprolysin-like